MRIRQLDDYTALRDGEPGNFDVAVQDGVAVGWVCTRRAEIYVLAVDPSHQRRGVGTALMDHAFARARAPGMAMMMVETGGDPGHAAARASYEAAGWPVARDFKELGESRVGRDR